MKPIKTYYYNKNNNFGDVLNKDILTKVFKIKIEEAKATDAELVCIGSLLESFLHGSGNLKLAAKKLLYPKTKVFGTGFIAEENTRIQRPQNLHETFFKKMEIYALRGKYTKYRVEKILNQDLKYTVLGDPGLLSSKLINKEKIEKKYRIGIVPHYVDKGNSQIYEFLRSNDDVIEIDILSSPLIFLNQIAQCETIISSAMHGLIAADSLGIPNQRIILSDKIAGGDYKYNDYYSAFDIEKHPYIYFRNNSNISSRLIEEDYAVTQKKVLQIQENLIKSFPTF